MRSISIMVAGLLPLLIQAQSPAWPKINTQLTFKAQLNLYNCDGQSISPLQNAQGLTLVDSARDKVIVHANVAVPLFGNINADVLYNFNTGQSVSYIPFLGICQPAPGNTTLNLTDILSRAFDPSANLTTFKGLESAPWD